MVTLLKGMGRRHRKHSLGMFVCVREDICVCVREDVCVCVREDGCVLFCSTCGRARSCTLACVCVSVRFPAARCGSEP